MLEYPEQQSLSGKNDNNEITQINTVMFCSDLAQQACGQTVNKLKSSEPLKN